MKKQSKDWVDKRIAKAGSEDAKKYGRERTDEEKLHLSVNSPKYWLGKERDLLTKEKISKTKKEIGLSAKQKEVLCKKVYKINLIDNSVIEYDSTMNASTIEKVNQSTISRWCLKNKVKDNHMWKY